MGVGGRVLVTELWGHGVEMLFDEYGLGERVRGV